MRLTKRTFAISVIVGLVFGLALAASANHVNDGGVDEAWNATMNQEAYWELRFGGEDLEVSCTKYNNHPGTGVGSYEAVVTKGGDFVRVYNPNTVSTVTGPWNPNGNTRDNRHHDISWVMKCNIEESTTTTSTLPTTTTTEPGSTTTTENQTTTTLETPTTTTLPVTTTSVPTESTTTTLPATTTSQPGTTTSTSLVELVETEWDASGTCDSMTTFDWGEGVIAVEVFSMDHLGQPQTEVEASTFTFDGQVFTHTVASPHLFTLIPVVEPGFVAVPAQIELIADHCTPEPSVTTPEAPETPATPDLEELPYTGLPLHVWAILGLVALASGGLIVRKVSHA